MSDADRTYLDTTDTYTDASRTWSIAIGTEDVLDLTVHIFFDSITHFNIV